MMLPICWPGSAMDHRLVFAEEVRCQVLLFSRLKDLDFCSEIDKHQKRATSDKRVRGYPNQGTNHNAGDKNCPLLDRLSSFSGLPGHDDEQGNPAYQHENQWSQQPEIPQVVGKKHHWNANHYCWPNFIQEFLQLASRLF